MNTSTRKKRKAAGLCVRCGKSRGKYGTSTFCRPCADYTNNQAKNSYNNRKKEMRLSAKVKPEPAVARPLDVARFWEDLTDAERQAVVKRMHTIPKPEQGDVNGVKEYRQTLYEVMREVRGKLKAGLSLEEELVNFDYIHLRYTPAIATAIVGEGQWPD